MSSGAHQYPEPNQGLDFVTDSCQKFCNLVHTCYLLADTASLFDSQNQLKSGEYGMRRKRKTMVLQHPLARYDLIRIDTPHFNQTL